MEPLRAPRPLTRRVTSPTLGLYDQRGRDAGLTGGLGGQALRAGNPVELRTINRMGETTRAWTLGIVAAVTLLAGCGDLDEFEDTFDTEFTVPKPSAALVPVEKGKKFTLENDPADADSVKFKEARLSVVAPAGSDLAFLSRIEIYVRDDDDNRTLVGEAEGFRPGETSRSLEIRYGGDLRPFVNEKVVRLLWIVYPVAWGYDWPDEGVTLRTDVTLLVNADIF